MVWDVFDDGNIPSMSDSGCLSADPVNVFVKFAIF